MAKENKVGGAITLDVKELRAGITELKKHMQTVKLEFEQQVSSMDNWNKSQDGVMKKLEQLGSTYEDQERIVKAYEDTIAKLYAKQAENPELKIEEEVRRLNNELLKAQAALGKTQKEQNKYNQTLDGLKYNDAIAKLEEDLIKADREFEDATQGMENFENETEGLNAKIRQLATTLNSQNKMVRLMEERYEKVSQEQGSSSKEAKALRKSLQNLKTTISQNEKELKDYKGALSGASNESEQTTSKNKKLAKSLKDVKKSSDETKQGFTVLKGVLSQVITRSLVTFAQSISSSISQARELRKELGMLEATAITTGKAFQNASNNLVEVAAITDDTGAAVEGLNNLMTAGFDGDGLNTITDMLVGASIKWKDTLKFEGLSDGLQETLATGKAIGPFAELLERAGLNTKKFDEGLANASTQAEKQQYVLHTLSKLGLTDVKNQYESINESLVENNKAILNQQVAYANLNKILEPLHTALLNMGTDTINKLAPAIETFSNIVLKALDGDVKGALEDSAEIFYTWRDKVAESFLQLAEKLPEQLPKIMDKLLDITGDGMDKFFKLLPRIFEVISSIITSVLEYLPELISNLSEKLVEMAPLIMEAINALLSAIMEVLPTLLKSIIEMIPEIIDLVAELLTSLMPQIMEAAIILFNGIVEALPVILDALIENLPKIINTLVQFLINNWPVILDGAIQLLMAVVDALPTIIEALVIKLPDVINAIISAIVDAIPELLVASGELFEQILEAIPPLIVKLIEKVPEIITTIIESLLDNKDDMFATGEELLEGLWEGIKSYAKSLFKGIGKLGEGIVDGFKKIFKIKSPSRLMRDEVGEMLGLGIGEGLLDSTKYVLRDVDKFGKSLSSKVKSISSGLQGTIAINGNVNGASNGVSNVNNFTQIINAPKQPSRIELYRQTKNLLALKGGN